MIVSWFLYVFAFLLATIFINLLRYVGSEIPPVWMERWYSILIAEGSSAVVLGTAFWMISLVFQRPPLRRLPYAMLILLRVLSMLAGLILLSFIGWACITLIWSVEQERLLPYVMRDWFNLEGVLVAVYVLAVTAILSFITQMKDMMGGRVLFNIFMGKYSRPKMEERIFMFMDLKSSTEHAERLGHRRYFELIQDCFHDLTESAVRNGVEIYQYVGDEAIMTWRVSEGVKRARCIRVFFDFRNSLERRRSYYEKHYGSAPVFKAGVNAGPVTVAQVGDIKRDIAYLSDVLNTASRIESICGDLGRDLLVSASIKELLADSPGLEFEPLGRIDLRGKAEDVELFGVRLID